MRRRRAASGTRYPPFPAALAKATAWTNSCKTFMKQLKGVSRLKSPHLNPVAPNGCWSYLCEIVIRPRLRPDCRAARLDIASCQWQPSYLRQERQRRAALGSDPRQQAVEGRPAAASDEARSNLS